jgi:hypothetical protein
MSIEVNVITAPADWACYLINGDCSGMEDDDIAACDKWANDLYKDAGWYVVDLERDEGGDSEAEFSHQYGSLGGTAQAGDVADYVIHKQL